MPTDPLHRRAPSRRSRRSRRSRHSRGRLAALALALALAVPLLAAGTAAADEHQPQRSGHPLRVVAYALHPVGVALDTVFLRFPHWVVHRADWLETLFGHTEADG